MRRRFRRAVGGKIAAEEKTQKEKKRKELPGVEEEGGALLALRCLLLGILY